MKIRTQLLISFAVFTAILILIAVLLFMANRQVDRFTQQVEIAIQVEHISLELNYLAVDYLLHQDRQQQESLEIKLTSLSELLARLHAENPEQQLLLFPIQSRLTRLRAVFNDVVATIETRNPDQDIDLETAFINGSWGRLEIQIQGILVDASLIKQQMNEQVRRWETIVDVLILLLLGLFGIYLLINFLIIYRRTLHSISMLEEGTRIIGSGNLDFAIPVQREDEIGNLTKAFNRMAANLKMVTASKADLEAEIAARKKAEEVISQYIQKLEQSNRELENFAVLASHDLQEPLRKITAFGKRLAETKLDGLDEKGKDYIERMLDATRRMQEMIDGLLDLSRISTRGLPFIEVNLNETAKTVVSNLESRIEIAKGEVIIDPLPSIYADPIQMEQLLQNLIGNALKFHREGVAPRVHVFAKTIQINTGSRQDFVQITVSDNGIGFDEERMDEIFQPLKRLVGRSEFDGIGMGLAICKTIVERQGGTITARSKPGKGSDFIVTLPVEQIS